MIDRRGHSILNHEGILTNIDSSDTSLAIIHSVYESGEDSDVLFDKREIKIGEKPGKVIIKSQSTGYNHELMRAPEKNSKSGWFGIAKSTVGSSKSSLFRGNLHIEEKKIQDELVLEVVHNVQIEPSYKSVYFQGAENPFTFNINHGSGEFAVSLNVTDIARFEHRGRELIIIPIRQGELGITI